MTEMAQNPSDNAPTSRRRLARIGAFAFKLALAGGALVLCWRVAAARFADFDSAAFWAHLSAIPMGAIALALGAAALSYAAIACYDLIAFRALGAGAPTGRIIRTGAVATALGQLFGFGLIIGAFARWRLLRHDGVTQTMAAGASAIVTIGFLSGLLVLGGAAAALWAPDVAAMTGAAPAAVRLCGVSIIGVFVVVLLASHQRRTVRIFRRTLTAPRPTLIMSQVALAAVDVFFAAAVLWLLTPSAAEVSFGAMFVAYIGVLAICLLANTPGGIGPLEGALLFALPNAPIEALLAGIVAFRIMYYATPGLLGLVVLIDAETGGRLASAFRRRTRAPDLPLPMMTSDDPAVRQALARSGRAEDELAHLGDKSFLPTANVAAFLMFRVQGRAIVALGDPIGDPRQAPELCARFLALAAAQRLTPVLYKTGPALAHAARVAGLNVNRLGQEAVIDLATFTIADRDRREVRRKVRKAAKTGVTIVAHAPGTAPLASYATICDEWQTARRTPEAGFSMGRCTAHYLSRFPIYEAQIDGNAIGFVSLWRSGDGREWSIDVMRYASDAPTGTMHALITAACDGARAAGAVEFNLCLAPLRGLSPPQSLSDHIGDWVLRHGERFHRLQGLCRFKAAFRPTWRPRYVARASGLRGLYGLWIVYRLIHRSAPAHHSLLATSPPIRDPHIHLEAAPSPPANSEGPTGAAPAIKIHRTG